MEMLEVLKFAASDYGHMLYGKRPIPYHSTILKGIRLPHAPLEDKQSGKNWYPDEVGGLFGFSGDNCVYFRQQTGIGFRVINALTLGYIRWLEKYGILGDNMRVYYPVNLLGFDVKEGKYVDIREKSGENVVPLSGDLQKLKEFLETNEKN